MKRVALITGASRGIGAAIGRRLARHADTTVVLTGRSTKAPSHPTLAGTLEDVARDIRHDGGRVEVEKLDVRDADAIRSIVNRIVERHGGIDVLVNNASAIDIRPAPPADRIDLMHTANCRGTLLMNLACIDTLEQRGGQILTLSPSLESMHRWLTGPALPYAVSKYGMTLATLGLSKRVKANCLWPKRTIATAATRMLEERVHEPYFSAGRDPDYFAEAVERVLQSSDSGRALLDEDVLPHPDERAPLDMFV